MRKRQEPLTAGEVAKMLDVSHSTAYNVLLYMESIEILQHVQKGRRKLYFLKDLNNAGTFISVQSPWEAGLHKKVKETPSPESSMPETHGFEPPEFAEYSESTSDMLPALAILGIFNDEPSEPLTQRYNDQPDDLGERKAETPLFIKVRRYGRVKALPKEARHLSWSDTVYLKDKYLKGLDGYRDVERFECFFSEMKALEKGEYGTVFYASMSTNPWEKAYMITVEQTKS
jgi:hypothetical protein